MEKRTKPESFPYGIYGTCIEFSKIEFSRIPRDMYKNTSYYIPLV